MKDAATPTRVVIVGVGFAGLSAAKVLGTRGLRSSDGLQLTVVDRRNHHLFQPLLYQVATAGLNPADISTPIRTVLKHFHNVSVRLGDVERIDLDAQTLHTSGPTPPR